MNIEQAKQMVDHALEERRRFGKHFTVRDMPPEFLDALLFYVDELKLKAAEAAGTRSTYEEQLKEQLTLSNRQLGAAKGREAKLQNRITQLVDDVDHLQTALNEAGK